MIKLPSKQRKITKPIPFVDLKTQQERIRPQIDAAIKKVLDHGKYIMGPEVYELEEKLAKCCGAKHAITCSSGTDALLLGLMAKGVGPGDAVFVPSFTFAATAEVVALLKAIPVFVDVLIDTYNIDPKSLELGINKVKKLGLKPTGVIPVDLFGQPADYNAIQAIADQNNMWVIADGAQSFGATYNGNNVGTLAEITTTSFFPAKPLGCYGDGGAVFTDNDELADVIRSLRVHGKGKDKYDNVRVGINGRLDTIQAAILLEKLKIFPEEIKKRQQVADCYNKNLNGLVKIPQVMKGARSTWAQYTINCEDHFTREQLQLKLTNEGIATAVYYKDFLHLQAAYEDFPRVTNNLKIKFNLCETVLSLPVGSYFGVQLIENICEVIKDEFAR